MEKGRVAADFGSGQGRREGASPIIRLVSLPVPRQNRPRHGTSFQKPPADRCLSARSSVMSRWRHSGGIDLARDLLIENERWDTPRFSGEARERFPGWGEHTTQHFVQSGSNRPCAVFSEKPDLRAENATESLASFCWIRKRAESDAALGRVRSHTRNARLTPTALLRSRVTP